MADPEIRRGDFIYRDTLFVDLGNQRRHPRASVSDLKDLLMPKGTAPKDQVAHFYEAQLVHYGLPRVKDKNAAKVKLMIAISAKSLKVPEYVAQMEAGMKKEYASALRKAGGAGGKEKETPAKGKKRKADDSMEQASTKISWTVSKDGDMRFEAEQKAGGGGPGSASKKAKSEPKPKPKTEAKAQKKSTSTPEPNAATKPASAGAARTTSLATRRVAPAASPGRAAPASSPARQKQTARRSRPFPHPSTSTRPPQQSPQRTYDHTPASFVDHLAVSDSEDDGPPPPYDSLDFNDTRSPSPPRNPGGVVQISGAYSLRVSTLSSRPLAPRTLSLIIDHETDSLWGTFHIGPKRGLIRMDDISGLASGASKTFGWRSEDENSNSKMRFGRGCDGEVQFDGQGGVKGMFGGGIMYGEDVEFWGGLEDQDERPDVWELREEWEAYPRRAYGRG